MQYDGHSELWKAAHGRLNDAWELMERPTRDPERSDAEHRHLCGALYLAGYAVECVLKVYVILLLDARIAPPVRRWSEALRHLGERDDVPDLSGARSHNLRHLLVASELEPQLSGDRDLNRVWGVCSKWDYNIRYAPHLRLKRAAVEERIQACDTVFNWVKARVRRN